MQRMNSLRRSLRDSFRRKREAPESTKPHQWQADEEAVRQGMCSFHVKYLGCVEVFESRGMNVCEEAMRVLRQSRRRPVKSVLFVSGDGLRVVEDDTKGLIVDQTIEKVSFCAPDRNHERGFSYICRDGTTRRWMCHGFLSSKDSVITEGERLSHAVGCAFAACLERKQKREKECGVSMTFDPKTSTFTRSGSFRVSSMTENPLNSLVGSSSSPPPLDAAGNAVVRSSSVANTSAIERPHAPVKMLERQGSFRGFTQLSNQSPFKRQLSLRLSDLPSNVQRAQNNVDILTNNNVVVTTDPLIPIVTPPAPPRTTRSRLHSLPNNSLAGVIPETSTVPLNMTAGIIPAALPSKQILLQQQLENKDLVSELCMQVTEGLSLLAANHDDSLKNNTSKFPTKFNTNPWDEEETVPPQPTFNSAPLTQTRPAIPFFNTNNSSTRNIPLTNNTSIPSVPLSSAAVSSSTSSSSGIISSSRVPIQSQDQWVSNNNTSSNGLVGEQVVSSTSISGSRPPAVLPTTSTAAAPVSSSWNSSNVTSTTTTTSNVVPSATAPLPPPHPIHPSRPPLISSGSVAGRPNETVRNNFHQGRAPPSRSHSLGSDPFDASWASNAAKQGSAPTNPFAPNKGHLQQTLQQSFQISM